MRDKVGFSCTTGVVSPEGAESRESTNRLGAGCKACVFLVERGSEMRMKEAREKESTPPGKQGLLKEL